MLKFFTLFFTLALTAMSANTNFSPYNTVITKVENKTIYIDDNKDFSIGSSGVVLHTFDKTHKTIIAAVEVVGKKDGKAHLKYKSFKRLKQEALPSYNITPKKGDTVILNYLYKRVLAIVPDLKTFDFVTKNHEGFEWIHPDIFAATLAADYNPVPTKDDFIQMCTTNTFALLFFAIEQKGYFIDCNSFKTIYQIDLPKELVSKKPMIPFYNRLQEIKGRVFGLMGSKGINNYDGYYKKLLGIK